MGKRHNPNTKETKMVIVGIIVGLVGMLVAWWMFHALTFAITMACLGYSKAWEIKLEPNNWNTVVEKHNALKAKVEEMEKENERIRTLTKGQG
jgi:hypothetical protein